MAINLIEKQQELAENLNIVLNAPRTVNQLRNIIFSTEVEKQINILGFLERLNKTAKKDLKAKLCVQRYNSLTNRKFEIDEKIKYDDLDFMVDDINYLEVYCKNILKVSIAELKATIPTTPIKTATADNPKNVEKIDPSQTKVVDNKTSTPPPPPNQNFGTTNKTPGFNPWGNPTGMNNPFGGMNPNMGNMNPNMDPHQNPWFISQAQARLKMEMGTGQVFIYDKKPAIIPIIKCITAALFALFAIAQIILIVFLCMSGPAVVGTNSEGANVSLDQAIGVVFNSIMYGLFALVFAWTAWWFIKPLISITNPKTKIAKPLNQNQIFFYMWQPFAFVGILYLVMSFLNIFLIGDGSNLFTLVSKATENSVNVNYILPLWGYYYALIAQYVILGLIVIAIISGAIFNPKQDTQKIQSIINQYIDDIAKNSGQF